MTARADDDLVSLLADCHDDPALFHEAILGRPSFHPKQEAIARSVVENRVTVVPAGHAVGKSWGAATTVLHWLYTRPNGKVVTTSASNNQLVSVLWAAIKGAKARSLVPLAGQASDGNAIPQRISLGPEWFALGFSAKKPESFSGFHGENLLVVVDEASGVDQSVFDAIESLGYTSLLLLGNPIRAGGHFRAVWDQAVAGAPGVRGFHLSAFDSPHADLTDVQIAQAGLPGGLTSKTWIDNVRRVYGEGSLYWKTRVLAQFPDEDLDVLIPADWLAYAIASRRDDRPAFEPALSVDLSKGTGRDRTVWMAGDDDGLLHLQVSNTTSLPEAAARTREIAQDWGIPQQRVVYDAGGWAGPDFRRYLEAVGLEDCVPYRGNATAGGNRWRNRRSRAAWGLRQRLSPDRPRITPPPVPKVVNVEDHELPRLAHHTRRQPIVVHPQQPSWSIPPAVAGVHLDDLRRELSELRYRHDGPKLELERKEDMVSRLGHSPDLADTAIMLASILWSPS